MRYKIENIGENFLYVTDKDFTFSLDDDKDRQFGVLFEILDMYEATGEKEYKQYPFLVSASLTADKCHKSFDETDGHSNRLSLIYDAHSYMGGVPVDHILANGVKGGSEPTATKGPFDAVCEQFSIKEAKVITEKRSHGTIAAQRGSGSEHSWLAFKTYEAAEKFVKYLIEHRLAALKLVGFVLDRPINMMGDSGWGVIEKQVRGVK